MFIWFTCWFNLAGNLVVPQQVARMNSLEEQPFCLWPWWWWCCTSSSIFIFIAELLSLILWTSCCCSSSNSHSMSIGSSCNISSSSSVESQYYQPIASVLLIRSSDLVCRCLQLPSGQSDPSSWLFNRVIVLGFTKLKITGSG